MVQEYVHLSCSFINDMLDGVFTVDTEGVIQLWNKSAELITGYAQSEMLGQTYSQDFLTPLVCYGEKFEESECHILLTLKDAMFRSEVIYIKHKKGFILPVTVRTSTINSTNGEIIGAVQIFRDNSPNKGFLQRNDDRKHRDSVTGLANRLFLEISIANKLVEMNTHGTNFGLMLTDVDFFDNLKKIFGEQESVNMLKVIAQTISNCTRSQDVFGRWGEVELLGIIPNVSDYNLYYIANRVCELVARSRVNFGDKKFSLTLSIGATMANATDNMQTIIRKLYALLQESKKDGGNCCKVDVIT